MVDSELGPSSPHLHPRVELSLIYFNFRVEIRDVARMVDLELGPSSPHLHSRAELSQIYSGLLHFFIVRKTQFLIFGLRLPGKQLPS